MVNRINRTMAEWKSNALIVHGEGKDYTSLIRRMGVYNPIRSKYNCWPDGEEFRNFPTDRILEDIFFRKSHKSDLIQMADFCAYALFRSEFPLPSKTRTHEGVGCSEEGAIPCSDHSPCSGKGNI